MEMVNTIWAILPPLIAIALALITKEVYSSLMIGIIAGALFYTNFEILGAFNTIFDLMGEKIGGNAAIILFLCFLGVIVVLMTKAGGSRAYGRWASTKIKSKSGALLATSALGALIFVDDYFNCLTVGTVMRPVTDNYKISRPKLAYIIDSTAAPICIIAPVSSWAIAVGGTIEDAGIANGFQVFMSTIPFNLYAIATLVTVISLSLLLFDFGKMKKFETGEIVSESVAEKSESNDNSISEKGRVFDLVIPIAVLIVSVIGLMVITGIQGCQSAETPIALTITNIFGNCAVNNSMVIGSFLTIIVMLVLYVPRKLMSFNDFMKSMIEGIKSMIPAIAVLTLAWTLSGICSSDYLQTGNYVGELIRKSGMGLQLIPAIIFLVAGALAFATGTSWGTFGILIPILVVIFGGHDAQLLTITISATLAGAVFGDHISPISDTTILSSAGADCNHIDHVSSQIPYAGTVAGCCFIGYIVAGFVQNCWLPIIVTIACLVVAFFILKSLSKKQEA